MEKSERLNYLDSIRGIAAFAVAVGHCTMLHSDDYRNSHRSLINATASMSDLLFYTIQKMLAGRAAVMMFFVLSGFVLSYSLLKRQTPYFSYAIKRVFRIYPVFLFVICLSYLLHCLIGIQHEPNSNWLKDVANPDLSFAVLLKHFLMFGTLGSNGLDNVMWTLVHEMRISLALPLILYSIIRYRWHAIFLYLALSFGCTAWVRHTTGLVVEGYNATTFLKTFLNTGFFIIFFAAGAFLAIEREKVARKIANLSKWQQIGLFIISIYFFLKTDSDNHTYMGTAVDYMRGIGSLGIIALALGNQGFREALNHRFLIWLGRISYTLYLVHVPILYVVNQTIGASWNVLESSIVIIILSLAAAEILTRAIELPMIEAGKRLNIKLATILRQ